MGMVWSQRNGLYLFGVLCLVLSTLLFAVCLVAPFWQRQDEDPTLGIPILHIGLWFQCSGNFTCFGHDYSSDKDFLHVTRGLQLGGILGLMMCVVMTCVANCRRQHPGHKADVALAIFMFIIGLLCGSGIVLYVIFTRQDVEDLPHLRYDWALALTLVASFLALLTSALFLFTICCRKGSPCRPTRGDAKRETTLNWQEDIYDDPRGGDEFTGVMGPYTVAAPSEGYFLDDHVRDDPRYLDHSCQFRPLPYPPAGEDEHPPGFPRQNVYSAFPSGDHSEVGPGMYDSHGRDRHEELPDMQFSSGWGLHGGIEMVPAPSPPWRRTAEEQWYQDNDAPRSYHPAEPVGPVYPAEHGQSYHYSSPFAFPRVVVRGYYEPGYGYPEYVMM